MHIAPKWNVPRTRSDCCCCFGCRFILESQDNPPKTYTCKPLSKVFDCIVFDCMGGVRLVPKDIVLLICLPEASSKKYCTRSGKTLVIIRVLDNFYFDKRAKIAVFPKDVVVDNFYLGFAEWPSRWRDSKYLGAMVDAIDAMSKVDGLNRSWPACSPCGRTCRS